MASEMVKLCLLETCESGFPRKNGTWYAESGDWVTTEEAQKTNARILCYACYKVFISWSKDEACGGDDARAAPALGVIQPRGGAGTKTAPGVILPRGGDDARAAPVLGVIQSGLVERSRVEKQSKAKKRGRSPSPPWRHFGVHSSTEQTDSISRLTVEVGGITVESDAGPRRPKRTARKCTVCGGKETASWWELGTDNAYTILSTPPDAVLLCDTCRSTQKKVGARGSVTSSSSARGKGLEAQGKGAAAAGSNTASSRAKETVSTSSDANEKAEVVKNFSNIKPKESDDDDATGLSQASSVTEPRLSSQGESGMAGTAPLLRGQIVSNRGAAARAPTTSSSSATGADKLTVAPPLLTSHGRPSRNHRSCAMCNGTHTSLWYDERGQGHSAAHAPTTTVYCDSCHLILHIPAK